MAASPDRNRALDRRRRFASVNVARGATRAATGFLILDTLGAVGLAAGLAGAIAAIARGESLLWPWLALMVASGLVRAASGLLSARFGAAAAIAAKRTLRRDVVGRLLDRMPGAGLTGGGAVNAAVDEVEAIGGYVARFLPARGAAAFAPLIVAGAVAVASPVSAAILIATLPLFVIALALAGGAAADKSRRQFAAMARLSSVFADQIRALPIILAYRGEGREEARLAAASEQLAARTMAVLRIAFLSSGALEFFSAISVALVAVYAGFNVLGMLPFAVPEHLDIGRAFFALAMAPEFYAPMRRLAAAYHDRQAAETAIDRLDMLPRRREGRAAPVVAAAPAIGFRDVTICYPGAYEAVVSGFKLEVAPGEIVALTGPSGSGKSSVLHALLGLAPVVAGEVTLDGVPVDDIVGVAAWAGQQPLLLPGSIADNIALGARDATAGEIERCAAAVGLDSMLDRRADRLATLIDVRGGGLSGGERRRGGLARALLKDAPRLLLDEPTAHLDAVAEREIIAVIREACAGRTMIFATHSPHLAAIADRVVEMGGAA